MTDDPDRLYDAYLDALLADGTLRPDEFLGDQPADARLRSRMEALHAAVCGEVPDPGSTLGDYQLIERLGEGGMGVVYLAEQTSLGRRVALKILRPELSSSPVAVERFEREARAVARLRHPHLVKCFDFCEHAGRRFLVMELAEGRSLDELLLEAEQSGEPVPVARALEWAAQIADGLHEAHQQGLVHRDVKPANLRISPEGRALLLDFGVARDLEADGPTLTRSFLGTPAYMAPEQIARRGGQVDARTDVYSLGVSLYECVTCAVPFRGDTVEALFHEILERDPPAPRKVRPGLSRDLETVVLRAIAKDPAERYPDAASFRDDLRALLEFRPIQARRPGPWARVRHSARRRPLPFAAAAALALTLLALGVMGLVQRSLEHRRLDRQRGEALAEARDAVQVYGREIGATRELEVQVLHLQRRRSADYMTDEEHRRLDAQLDAVVRGKTQREQSFHAILEMLRRADGLGVDPMQTSELRGRLYLARLQEVRAEGDPVLDEVYRDLVLEHDPHGVLRQEMSGSTPLHLEVDVDSAEVHVFRLVEAAKLREGGGRRQVAVPLRGDTPDLAPETVCLEVLEGVGEVEAGDLILSLGGHPIDGSILVRQGEGEVLELDRLCEVDGQAVTSWYEVEDLAVAQSFLPRGTPPGLREFVFRSEGGEVRVQAESLEELGVTVATPQEFATVGGCPATVLHRGVRRERTLPEGLTVRTTASPWPVGEASLVGLGPLEPFFLPQGSYGVLVLAPGHPPLRHVLELDGEADGAGVPLTVAVPPPPAGFVRVIPGRYPSQTEEFCIQRYETTFGEYLEFLNDPQVQERIRRSPTPILVPRGGQGQRELHVLQGDDGRYQLQPAWPPDLPVFGVSWDDAVAFAEWRSERARHSGQGWSFALPTHAHWCRAAAVLTEFPFGERFHPRWIASAYSRPRPFPFRVGSFPVDASPLGVMDMSGNVSEWLDEWWLEDRGHRRHAGGSWAMGGPESVFGVQGGNGSPADSVSSTIGFRLIAVRSAEGAEAAAGAAEER